MKHLHWMLAATALVIGVTAGSAQAGLNGNYGVYISDDPSFSYAIGSFVGARNSPDNVQYLGCTVNGDTVYCYAQNTAGVYRMCSSSNPTHVANGRAMSGEGFLQFGWNASGICTFVVVGTGSQLRP